MDKRDNSLEYNFIGPDKSIADFVYEFSMIRNMWKIKEVVLIPEARIDILFAQDNDNKFYNTLIGLETEPKLILKNNHKIIFGISFSPLAAEYILKQSVADILDGKKMLPDNFLGFCADDLKDFEAFSVKISKRLKSLIPKRIDGRKQKVFELIHNTQGEIPVREISEKVFWSARQINRYFDQQFGLSLKEYCQIVRFQASLPYLKAGKLFPRLNYYDQSHFIKEVKRFSGVTPKQLSQNRNDRFLQFLAINEK